VAEPEFLLDTNILVYLIGGKSEPLRDRVESYAPGLLATSTLCVAEAGFGLRHEPRARAGLDRLLSVVLVRPFDLAAALRFPDVPFHRGRVDRFVAAQALALGLVVVTNNEQDFVDVPGLRIENWTKP